MKRTTKYEASLYTGCAGDFDKLLTVKTNNGEADCLFNTVLPFYRWRLKRAINRLLDEIKIMSPSKLTARRPRT